MFDATSQINAVDRRVSDRTLPAGTARVVSLTQTYDATVADVWDACTNPERLPRWFLPVSGELRVGGRYKLEGNAEGTVERCDPPNSFAATWEFGGDVSWIEVQLTGLDDGRTRLRLEHVAHVDDERWAQYGPGAVGVGWDLALLGLSANLAQPDRAVDPQEAMAWSLGDEGRAFALEASQRWGLADAANGTDEEQARAAAERTAAFYTTAPPTES